MNQPSQRFERLHQLQRDFAAHIRDPEGVAPPEGIEDRRMGIYRDLFFNNIRSFISFNYPVLKRLHTKSEWNNIVRDFYIRHRCHTPLFPELPREFLKYIENHRGESQGDPPFMLELAHYEWVELALALDAADPANEVFNPDGDLLNGVPVVSPVAWRLTYKFPVHQIKPEFRPEQPPAQPTHLIVYRAPDLKVRFIEINAVTARLVEMLQAQSHMSGLDCLNQIGNELGMNSEAMLEPGQKILTNLHQKGILLGTAP